MIANTSRTGDESENIEFIFCGFGSSLLFSDYDDEQTNCWLKSLTTPWDAPEASRPLKIKNAFTADIYSFGLFFARVILDGNNPFDNSFHIATEQIPTYNMQKIKRLKTSDKIVEMIVSRISDLKIYSDDQLNLIKIIFSLIFTISVEKRISTIKPISKITFAAVKKILNGENLEKYATQYLNEETY
jgi:hypothetical protein